ncbi:hypothetical protein [Clavibacter michiganensis]|uniref:hypothetical protein n=1 Tax=Clavibacter michiganensis TaxID=28447 RepID=UPI000CE7C620|nr:hypothetical protein [Clavibacter michiganensis]
MLAAFKEATQLHWDTPYRLATSLVALLLIFDGYGHVAAHAGDVAGFFGATDVESALRVADVWLEAHMAQLGPTGPTILLMLGGMAAHQGYAVPTRAAGTVWVAAALASYAGEDVLSALVPVGAGVLVRFAGARRGHRLAQFWWALLNVAVAGFWAPIWLGQWVFSPGDGAPNVSTGK